MNGKSERNRGFTLIELIVVIAIIGIMAALIVAVITNATQDTRSVLARQQMAVMQEALNAWVAGYTMTYDGDRQRTLADAMSNYTAQTTVTGKLNNLLKNYLDNSTYEHFTNYSTATKLQSEAMAMNGNYLIFTAWSNRTTYPMVQMQQEP